ncbi:MAG: glycosyltransferase family 39 protein [Anaerolineae bacterium]|nr:glycosyltransferase family 39 protein [Anaerolineae bacterium]
MFAKRQLLTQFKHWPLVLVLTVFAGLALTYNLILPLGEVSDASAHFALIRFIAEEGRPPLTLAERSAVGIKGDASPVYHGLVALLTQHVDISSFPELPRLSQKAERAIPGDQCMILTYFHTEDEAWPFQGIALAWHLAGLASIPMGMATIIAVYLTVLAIYPGQPNLALAAAAFVAFLPRFIISSAVINDDNLVFPLIAFALYYLIKIIHGDQQRRTFIILGLLLGLAAITKYHSLILLPEIGLVLLVLGWRRGWGWATTFRRGMWVLAAFAVTAGWWLGFILIKFNDIENSGLISGLAAPFGDPVVTEGSTYLFSSEFNTLSLWEFDYWLSWTFRSFWLHYNGLDSGLAALGRTTTYWAVYAVFGLLLAVAMVGLLLKGVTYAGALIKSPRTAPAWRLDLTLLAVHFLIYLGLVILRYMLFPAWSTSQGRHLYPALTSIALFFVLGLDEVRQRLNTALTYKFGLTIFSHDLWVVAAGGGPLLVLSLAVLPLFFWPVYYPLLPIKTSHPNDAPITHRLTEQFADELRFEGYDQPQTDFQPGQPIPVTLYWRTRLKQPQDYLIQTCLHDKAGAIVTCHQGYPANGRYPVRAWEEGYLIRDQVYVPTPTCLSPGDYNLSVTALPLRLDTPAPTIDPTITPKAPVSLGPIHLAGESSAANSVEIWIAQSLYTNTTVDAPQLRQTMTVINYAADETTPPALIHNTTTERWLPFETSITYPCADGSPATTYSFIAYPGLSPGLYHPNTALSAAGPQVNLLTRPRNFRLPASIGHPLEAVFDQKIELLGYDLDPKPRLPGQSIEVTTYWRSLETMNRGYIGSFHLLDNTLSMWGQSDSPLGSDYPTVLWSPGEVITSVYKLPVNSFVAAGQYTLKLSIYDLNEGRFDFLPAVVAGQPEPATDLYLGQVRILDPDSHNPPDQPLQVTLGDQIQLLGYQLKSTTLRRDEPLRFGLFWQATQPISSDYTVFTQLIGPDGQVWAQQDNQPQGGSYPTSTWTRFDTVVDRYELSLNDGAPPGQYQLLVGQYDLNTGQRLPAVDAAGQRLPNDAIVLGLLTLE